MNANSPHNSKQSVNMALGQLYTNKILDAHLLETLVNIPREDFVPENLRGAAYVDEALEIASGRFLLAPLTIAQLLQLAQITPSCRVLVIGDNGYITNIISPLAGHVVTIENNATLLTCLQNKAARSNDINIQQVNNLADGFAQSQPYDVIFINGAVEYVPDTLTSQLAIGGRLVTVHNIAKRPGIAGGLGKGIVVRRLDGQINTREHFDTTAPLLPGFEHTKGFHF